MTTKRFIITVACIFLSGGITCFTLIKTVKFFHERQRYEITHYIDNTKQKYIANGWRGPYSSYGVLTFTTLDGAEHKISGEFTSVRIK